MLFPSQSVNSVVRQAFTAQELSKEEKTASNPRSISRNSPKNQKIIH
jgi:hypothetical protein